MAVSGYLKINWYVSVLCNLFYSESSVVRIFEVSYLFLLSSSAYFPC